MRNKQPTQQPTMHPVAQQFIQALQTLLNHINTAGKTIGNQPITTLQAPQPNLRQAAQTLAPQSLLSHALSGQMQKIPGQVNKDAGQMVQGMQNIGLKNPTAEQRQLGKQAMGGVMSTVDFSQPPTGRTDNFLADAEHHIKYNVALQAMHQGDPATGKFLLRPDAEQIAQAIYDTDVKDATNPMEMVNMIYRNLPTSLQNDPGVLNAIKNYGTTANQLFASRVRGSEIAPILGRALQFGK